MAQTTNCSCMNNNPQFVSIHADGTTHSTFCTASSPYSFDSNDPAYLAKLVFIQTAKDEAKAMGMDIYDAGDYALAKWRDHEARYAQMPAISGGTHDETQPTPADHNAVHVLFEPGCNECELRLCRSVINEYQPVSEYMSARDFAEYMQKWRDRMNRAIDRQRAEQSPLTYAEWVNLWSAARTNPNNTPEALDAVYKMHPGYQSLIQENASR